MLIALLCLSSFISAQTPEMDSLENIINEYKNGDTIKINLLNEAAYKQRKFDLNKTLEYAKTAESLADKIKFAKGKAESLRIIGIHYYYISNYPLSIDYYQKSLKLSTKENDKNGIAKCLNNIGNVYRKQGDYLKSLEYFQKSLQIAEEIDNKDRISSALGNIGLIYWKQGDYSQALEYYKKSLNLFEELDYKKGISNSLNNIGILYYYLNNYSHSLEYFKKSLEIDEELGDKSGISYSLNNIGEIYMHIKDYSQAITFYQKSLKIRNELGDNSGICSSYKGLGAVYFKTKNYKKALDFTKKSLKIALDLELLDQQKEIYEQLSKIYAHTKNYKRAYESYVLYKGINDSIFNEDNIKKIAGLEYQYEYEKEKQVADLLQQKKDALYEEEAKREKIVRNSFIIGFTLLLILVFIILLSLAQKRKANIILGLQKRKIEIRNAQLKQLNATQNRLMSIISHDLKAPLSAFYSITNSLITKFDKIDRKEINNYLSRMLNSSIALKLQLENMLNWSINQTKEISVNKNQFNLLVLVCKQVMILQEFANEKSITIENVINENIDIETDGRLLSVILNNLIANAIKFSPDKSTVFLSVQQNNGHLVLSVKDNGIGMDKETAHNLFSDNKNTVQNENSGSGLGLVVSKDLVNKIGGEIWVESELNKGTEIFIKI